MPRMRPKRQICDCLDCTDEPSQPRAGREAQTLLTASARQEPPPTCFLLFGDGFLQLAATAIATKTSLDIAEIPHLHAIARDGSCGFLALRQTQTAVAEEGCASELQPLSQLFGITQGSACKSGRTETIQQRFKGMTAAFVTSDMKAGTLAAKAGFDVQQPLQAQHQSPSAPDAPPPLTEALPAPEDVASKAASMLGLTDTRGSTILENELPGMVDMVVLHVRLDSGAATSSMPCPHPLLGGAASALGRLDESAAALQWLDRVVLHFNQQPGARESVIVGVVLGSAGASVGRWLEPGGLPVLLPKRSSSSSSSSSSSAQADLAAFGHVLRPRQSFQKAGLEDVSVREDTPLLAALRLPGVIRCDKATKLGLEECHKLGGNRCILAERWLPEVAYKLGRASKYGA